MDQEDYKTSESVDMKNPLAVNYAAEEAGVTVREYKLYADRAGTYHRKSVEKYISRYHYPLKKG